jgi:chaperonin GroES
MSINALDDKVIIKVAKVEEKTESGFYIPDTAMAMPDQGTVVAVGPGRTTNTGTVLPTGINVGDVVLFNRRAAQKIELDDEEYLVFLSEHILGIFTE